VVIDVDGATAYTMAPGGSVEAIDLATGGVAWTSQVAAKPLGLHAGLLVAQAEIPRKDILRLVLLDTSAGGQLKTRTDLVMPDKVRASIGESAGKRFEVRAISSGDDLYVAWEYRSQSVSGLRLGPGITLDRKKVDGTVRLDPETGVTVPVALDELQTAPTQELPSILQQLYEAGELSMQPARAGDVLYAFDPTAGDLSGRRTIRRWQTGSGEPLPPIRTSTADVSFKLASSNSPHFLASGAVGQGARRWERFAWEVYDLETGASLGETRSHVAAAPFVIWNGMLIHELQPHAQRDGDSWIEEPRQLKAIALSDGAERWRRPLRDLRFRGFLPPVGGGSAVAETPNVEPETRGQ
jgi:hypothetical protein